MIKKLFFWLAILVTAVFFLHSCVHDDFDRKDHPQESTFNVFQKSSDGRDPDYAKGFALLYKKYTKLHPEFSEAQKRNKKENGAYMYLYMSSQMFILEDGSKTVLFPIIKENKVAGIAAGILNKKEDYVSYRLLSENTDGYQDILAAFASRYRNRAHGTAAKVQGDEDCGNDDAFCKDIEPIVITPPKGLNFGNNTGGSGEGPKPWENPPEGGCGGFGNCGGGSFTPNPSTPPENPCEKMKAQGTKQTFKDKISELDKKEVFDKTKETGFAVAYGPQTNYETLVNTANDNLKMPDGNKYFGYIHTHLDSKEGTVKIFSPADVFTFLTICVRNAQTKGTMTDAYGMVITSQGNYILKYSGDGNYGIGPNIKADWQSWYDREYSNLLENSGGLNQADVEKLFTQFLKEKVNISGLEVYKSDKATGSTAKLEYNGKDNPVKPIPCP